MVDMDESSRHFNDDSIKHSMREMLNHSKNYDEDYIDVDELAEDIGFGGQDFSTEELINLKKAMQFQFTDESLYILKQNPILYQLPLYRLFCFFFSIWFNNEQVFTFLMEQHNFCLAHRTRRNSKEFDISVTPE